MVEFIITACAILGPLAAIGIAGLLLAIALDKIRV